MNAAGEGAAGAGFIQSRRRRPGRAWIRYTAYGIAGHDRVLLHRGRRWCSPSLCYAWVLTTPIHGPAFRFGTTEGMEGALLTNARGDGGTVDGPLRVFVLADHLGHGAGRVHGGTTYFLNTIPAMVDSGLEVTVCFMQARHPQADHLDAAGVNLHFLGLGKWSPRALWMFEPIVRACRPHVVHLHSFKSHLAGRSWAQRTGTPAVVHVHDHNVPPAPLRFLLRAQAGTTDALVGITRAVTEFASHNYGVDPARCHTVPCGLNQRPFLNAPSEARADVRTELGIDPDAAVFGVVGRLAEVKGQDQLLRAVPDILQRVPDAVLMIVGDGPTAPNLRALVARLGIERHVVFTGQRSDIPSINQALDVAVMPSTGQEAFGLIALEAMLSGRPVVAFDSPGVRDLIEDGKSGYLVERFDLATLARRIVALLTNTDLRAAMGAAARARAMTFTLDRHVARMIGIFRGVMERRRAKR